MIGASTRFAAGSGELTSDNVNSLDTGGNVWRSGTLLVSVSALNYWSRIGANPTRGAYAGASAQAVTQSATNYVYLDSGGALVINTTGFPAPKDEDHIPLAEVICNGTDVTSITDRRPRLALGVIPQLPSYTVAELAALATVGAGTYRMAFATNGRKTGEGAAAGTGVLVYWDGSAWLRAADDSAVAA